VKPGQEDKLTKSVTLREVAERAGVSLGTASQALNNRPHVSATARERVLMAAQELGYVSRRRPQETAISTIGLLIKHDSGPLPRFNYFFSYVQAGVEVECHSHRINLMVAIVKTDQNNRPVDGWPRIIEEQSVDGFILVGLNVEPTFSELRQQLPNKPIVLVDSYAFGFPFDSVVIDNIGGAIQAVNYLVDRGHRCIGLLGTNKHSSPDIRERREGYYWALAARQIDEVYVEEGPMQREEGYHALKRLLQRAPHVTAVFAVNDETAIGALQAAHEMRIAVPEELSIIGFDDIDMASEVRPALTTIHVPKMWLGRLGVRRLLERAQSSDAPAVTISVATHLVERNSVGPCRNPDARPEHNNKPGGVYVDLSFT
jgi:LacI family transcriptional regulator